MTFASSFRVKTALCCSVAVLLAACGGTTDEPANQQLLADTVAGETTLASSARPPGAFDAVPTAPETIAQDAAMPDAMPAADDSDAPAMPDPAPAPPDNGVANAAPATQAAEGKAPASDEFNLNGYQDAAPASDSSARGTSATASADGQQATQPPRA